MTVPNLIHPINIVVEQISKGTTIYDPDSREPIQQADRPVQTTILGQPKWMSQKDLEMGKGGAEEGAAGYVLFRQVDLAAAGITLEVNDCFKKIGHVDTDVYIIRLEWCGHYPDTDGPSMVKAHFADRAPAKQTRGTG